MRSNLEIENSRTGIAGSPFCLFDNQKEAGKIKKPKLMYYKKQNWVVAIVATLITMGVASCGKDVQPESVADTPSLTKSAEELNPFTYIGKEHNYALDYVGTALQPLLDSIAGLSFVTHDDIAMLYDSMVVKMRDYFVGHSGLNITSTDVNSVVGYVESSMYNENDYLLVVENDSLTALLDSFYTTLNPYITEYDYLDSLDSCVARFIPTVITSSDSSLLLSLTVYQYSLKYWVEAMGDATGPWYAILQWADAECFEDCVGDVPDGKNGPKTWLGRAIKRVGEAIVQACQNVAKRYTSQKVALCDLEGALAGASMASYLPVDPASSALICAVTYSLLGPAFVK